MRKRSERFLFGLAAVLTVFLAVNSTGDLTAQAAYKAANSYTSIIPRKYGFFSVGFAETQLGVTFVYEPGTRCRYGECDSGGFGFAAYASVSARKGQDDLFANFTLNPGFAAGGRVSYTIRQSGSKYDVVYLGAGYSSVQLKLAELNPLTTVLSLTERYRRDLIGSIGYNHAFGRATVVGVSVEARREFGSAGFDLPEEICVPGTYMLTGTTYPVCSHRYTRETIEPLPDLWAGHARADVQIRVASLGSAASVPMLALVGAGSVDRLEGANTTYNWAVGAAIVPAAYPGQSMVALTAGFIDATNANGVAPGFHDRLVVSVTVGVPFDMILSRR
jgi:hypothetical protein